MTTEITAAANAPKEGARILVIDDEEEIGRSVRLALRGAHFNVTWEATARAGVARITSWHPDLVILDLVLPDADGLQVCSEIRSWSPVPILILSVRENVADKITALESGADDYLEKPFDLGELLARVRVALRHAAHSSGAATTAPIFTAGDLQIDFAARQVLVRGTEVHLTPTEYGLLTTLARHAGKIMTHHMLLRAVWGPEYADDLAILRVCVAQLRRKIEVNSSLPQILVTDPGIGYRLRQPDISSPAAD